MSNCKEKDFNLSGDEPIYCFDHKKYHYSYRNRLVQLKKRLGGECIHCKCKDLFKLEFDHIDPSLKTKQITKISKSNLEKELKNIQLLCGNCHRIKSYKEQLEIQTKEISRFKKFKNSSKEIIYEIKKQIGGCQICKWTIENKEECSYALDFDHISGDKIQQISNLYSRSREILLNEILKTRIICRCCHQLYTCIQKGGYMLRFYYDDKTIKNFESLFKDENLNIRFQNQIKNIVQKYFIKPIDITNFDDLKNFEKFYKINKNGDIYSIRNKCLMKQTNKKDGTVSVVLRDKTYYINDLLSLQYNS